MKRIFFLMICLFFAINLNANEKLSTSINVDSALYFKADDKCNGNQFTGISGYDGFAVVANFHLNYKINEISEVEGFFEFSPITFCPGVRFSVTPIPVLVLSTGASIGTGWNPLNFDGLKKYNPEKADYEDLTPFKNSYYDIWASVAFQFDLGEVIKSDWTHFVLYSEYKTKYMGMTGLSDDDCWAWRTVQNYTNGFCYEFYNLIGYRFPSINILFAGAFFKLYGYYKENAYAEIYKDFDGDFVTTAFGPAAQFKINENNLLGFLVYFETRRAYTTHYNRKEEQLLLKRDGTELFLNYIGFSFVHKF